ncbi:uncharacterized protein BCR38DRAFT_476344 [Pseudomassariella vexata]|uniref:DNA (cytosine-5-)-methyltransferase n=1 Tax=Pseudomassariella vexata TaxID=1141098 RepID=A0A1Y2DQS7_9PEZI|nr:uncharacterized protein BCR38DRAFT_476344 [Pseudomassariella vexata]ORY61652.1 hypothetical protein BCR38DRAFT_476344 [Pseudomassariella vexata]
MADSALPRSEFDLKAQYDRDMANIQAMMKEEEEEEPGMSRFNELVHNHPRPQAPIVPQEIIEIEDEDHNEFIREIENFIDLTSDDVPSRKQKAPVDKTIAIRNLPIDSRNLITQFELDEGVVLKDGITVELRDEIKVTDKYRFQFLRIKHIFRSPTTGEVFLRGLPFTRTRTLRGQIPRLRNEVAMMLMIDEDDARPDEEQAMIEFPLANVRRIRNLVCTNADFPQIRYDESHTTKKDIEENGLLVCRWKYRLTYRNSVFRAKGQTHEWVICHLGPEDASKERYRFSEDQRRARWRGTTMLKAGRVRGGSFVPGMPDNFEFIEDVDNEDKTNDVFHRADGLIDQLPGQRYIFGDMFCGGGGSSCGAKMAGLKIQIACDANKSACDTYSTNFPETSLYQTDIFDFISRQGPSPPPG